MLGFKGFRSFRKKKRSQATDSSPKESPLSSTSFPEEAITPENSDSVNQISTPSTVAPSAQSTPATRSRPASEEITASLPPTPTPKPRPISEIPISSQTDTAGSSVLKPSFNRKTYVPRSAGSSLVSPSKVADRPQSSSQVSPESPRTPTRSLTATSFPKLAEMMSPRLASGHTNGANGTNGVLSPPLSPKAMFRAKGRLPSFTSSRAPSYNFSTTRTTRRTNGGGSYKIGFVQESASSLKKRSMAELGAGVYQSISDVSYVRFLEWIRSERLTTLPHKGSRWDKVLIRSLYFAEQLHKFEQAIQSFALDSSAAAAVGYGHAQLLLELSHDNSEALDKAFSVFYKFAMSFSSVLHRSELLAASSEVREQLCLLYTDLLSLVVDVAIRFYKTVNGMTAGTVSLDIFELFGDTIETFRTRQNNVVELIWDSQIENEEFEEGEAIDVKVLSRWLAPQDRVLESLNRDHSTFVDQQVEFTCLWFQKHLSRFIQQSEKNFFLITGEPGAGKTTLAGSIVERLQRPVNRKQYDTLFCSLSPDIPTTATSLAVVKTLLFQLLNLRVGNMATYYALFKAYHQCRTASDIKTYEDHLWQALADALSHPVSGGNDLIMVVDGLDEIADSKSASIQASGAISPAALLEKLVGVTNKGHGVQLITLSSSMKMPESAKGIQHQVTKDDLRDDIHAVALRALAHNHHFHSQRAYDQEQVLDRIIQSSNGSFLYTILVCQVLNAQKTPDALAKVLETIETKKLPIQELIQQLFIMMNTNNDAKTLLSWILAAERPLTIDEIKTLFTVDVKRGTISDAGVKVDELIHSIEPLLTLHERIVRFKHPIIHAALHDLAHHNKIQIPLKESETDLLFRVLTYAKLTLREKGEPKIDNSDPSVGDRLYHQHRLLEYTVRYWVLHLQQSPLAPQKTGEYKPSAELQKVLPDTTVLAILEQLVWDTQLPLPQAIDLHKEVGIVRKAILGENHPAVLQTYLAIATSYLLISDTTHSAQYFYWSTLISRKVLSDIHPLTLECANYYLRITESLTTTTRTEIVTRREELLIILITAYERQYGSTSEMVIHTRKLLAELYASINEEDKAMEIYQLIQQATVQQYGRNSHQAREIQDHLDVVLGKGRGRREIEGYKETFFHGDDEEDVVEIFDIASIVAYLDRAKSHFSKNEFALAERTYVELWMEVSSQSRRVQSIEWHEKNIEVATAYSKFLKTQKRTSESSAILTCVWQQYEHSQLSFSETIVSRLTSVAKEMRSVGLHTQALSIFKYASSYFKSVRKEESSFYQEIHQQLSETSTEIVKQSLNASSSVTETTTTVSESVFQDVFFSIIESSKTVESSTIALSKKLTLQYMEKKNYSAAVSVITATLQRTWSSFLASSIHDVTMTSSFTQESIELVERLAECYQHTRQLEKVEDTYNRLFRAVLITEKVDKTVFERAQTLLINFYDKHGYADKAISIFQEILVTYRARFGASHDLTIQTLYTLGRRCQKHPRNHPYWIDYYLQIITSLNKDSDVCHTNALDAITVVTTTYWEDRRYAEAVSIYRVLWKTYITKTKEYKAFSEQKFVQTLYERFYQCLEETKASWSELHQVTSEYQKTVTASFSAESSIAVEATLSLAQVSQRSEEHASQAIALFEEVANRSKTVTTHTTVTEINQALSSLYVKQLQSSSSSTLKAETIQRALTMTETQLQESTSMYGYSHESSLTHLREVSVLYSRQQKTELAIKQLNTAISQIITKEQSSQKQIESAESIAMTYRSIEQTSTAHSLVQELHRQICAKDSRYVSKWSFDLTKSSRSSLAFLAALQYHLRKDLNITFAEIMADLTLEYIYFEQFHKTLANNESLTNILLAGAPLRFFLRKNEQHEMVGVVEDQAVGLFVKRDAQDLNTLSKESPRIFIIGILDQLGNGRNKDFNRSVILASNDSVSKLTKAKKFPEAYDIANLGFLYASKHDGYNGPRAISLGFKLASLLVGRDGEKATDAALRKKMLDLSNRIVKRILEICKTLNINFAQIQLFELSHLSVLLGEQEDYETLEWLLTTLWNTRDAQRTWPASVLLNLGRRLICARYLAGHPVKAIRLAEDIAYNMRRAHGPRAPVTIETYELLAELYTSTGLSYQAEHAKTGKTEGLAKDYFKKAVGVHEDVLRLMVADIAQGEDSDDDDLDTAAELLAREGVSVKSAPQQQQQQTSNKTTNGAIDASAVARRHLGLLKLAFQRLGGWPKRYEEYERLNALLFRAFGKEKEWTSLEGVEKWDAKAFGAGKAESKDGEFERVSDWGLGKDEVLLGVGKQSGQVVV